VTTAESQFAGRLSILVLNTVARGTSEMTDLHEGRGPKLDRHAIIWASISIGLFCGSYFSRGLGGPDWLSSGLSALSIGSAFIVAWVAAKSRRRRQ
jgi:hypothetical protein